MIRVAIYSRYSSENQSENSIEDQIRLCRERAEREGWHIAEVYTDAAISGSSILRRPGVQMLMQEAMRGTVDIVLAEALDRVSRDQEDIAGIYKRLEFSGVKMITLSEGEITPLHIGLKGTMNQIFLKDLRDKVKRGQRGRIENGKSGGGNAYGYDVLRELDTRGEIIRGERRVNEQQAAIVRRIFQDYKNGLSPKAIAARLNAEQVEGPSGLGWSASTITGNWQRGTGILNNEMYIGELVWNRVSYPKDPRTGRKVSRLNPESEWIRKTVPEMRILDQGLWDAVKGRQRKWRCKADEFWQQQRPKYIFSRLLECGCCQGGMSKMSSDRYGCSTARNKGIALCSNKRMIKQADLEHTVLSVLQERLMQPELVAKFAEEYTAHINKLRMERNASLVGYHKELAKLRRKDKRMVQAIMDGYASPQLKADMDAMVERQNELIALIESTDEAPVLLHPNMALRYRQEVNALVRSLNDDAHRHEATELIRSLIQKVVLTPDPKSAGLLIDVHGDLAGILNIAVGEAECEELDLKQIRLVVGIPEPVKPTVSPKVAAANRMKALQAANMGVGKMVAAEASKLGHTVGKMVAVEASKLGRSASKLMAVECDHLGEHATTVPGSHQLVETSTMLVEPRGVEPLTSSLRTRRSTN